MRAHAFYGHEGAWFGYPHPFTVLGKLLCHPKTRGRLAPTRRLPGDGHAFPVLRRMHLNRP